MKKRLTALVLCLVMMLSVFLASCADQSLEDAKADVVDAKTANTKTLSMWIVSEKPVDDDIKEDVVKAISSMTEAKYKTRLDITYLSEEEYYAKLTEAIAAFQKKKAEDKAAAQKETGTTGEDEEETTIIEFVTDENGMYRDSYPVLLENQVDIIYIGDLEDEDGKLLMSGREMYTSLLNKGYLAALDDSIKGSSKKIKEYVSPTLLSAVQDMGKTYAIPNNNVIGEYTYMCLNKTLMDRYSMQGFFTRNAIDSFYNEYVFQYLNMVTSNETGSLIPVDASYEECLALLAYYWNIDPSDYSINSDEFSIFGTLTTNSNLNRGEDAVTVDSLFANEDFVSNYLKLNKYRYDNPEFFRGEANAEKEYDACAIKFLRGDLSVLTIENESYYYYDTDGTCYYVVPIVYPTAKEADIYSDMFAVSSTTDDVDRAMEIITYINTNKEFRNLLQYGVLDQHYTIENGTVTRLKDKKGNSYEMDIYATGNAFLAYPEPTMDASIWENGKTQNRQSQVAPLLGFDLGAYADTLETFGTPEVIEALVKDYSTTYQSGFTKELLSTDATLKEWLDACDKKGTKGVYIFEAKEKKGNDLISVLYIYNTMGEYDVTLETVEQEREGFSTFARNNTFVYTAKAEGTAKGLGYTLTVAKDICPSKNEGSTFISVAGQAVTPEVKNHAKLIEFDVYSNDLYNMSVYGDLSVAHFYENKELYNQLMIWKGDTKLVEEETYIYKWVDSTSSETKNYYNFLIYRNNVFQATLTDVIPLFNGTDFEIQFRVNSYKDVEVPKKSYRLYYVTLEVDKNVNVTVNSMLNGVADPCPVKNFDAETVHDFKVHGMLNTELIKYMDALNQQIIGVLNTCETYADLEKTVQGLTKLLSPEFQVASSGALGNCPALKTSVASADGVIKNDFVTLFYQLQHITNYNKMSEVTGLTEELKDAKETRVCFYSPFGIYYKWMSEYSYLPAEMQK